MNLHVVIGEISDWLMLVERYVIAYDDIMGNYLCPSEGIIASFAQVISCVGFRPRTGSRNQGRKPLCVLTYASSAVARPHAQQSQRRNMR